LVDSAPGPDFGKSPTGGKKGNGKMRLECKKKLQKGGPTGGFFDDQRSQKKKRRAGRRFVDENVARRRVGGRKAKKTGCRVAAARGGAGDGSMDAGGVTWAIGLATTKKTKEGKNYKPNTREREKSQNH